MENLILLTCFFIFALFTAISMLIMGYIFSYKNPEKIKSSTYECGLAPKTSANISFNIRYFYYLIMFLIIDVSSIFMYPLMAKNYLYSKNHTLIIEVFLLLLLISIIVFFKRTNK